jgi:glycosyltransferase involved in cell wall biosynthesis
VRFYRERLFEAHPAFVSDIASPVMSASVAAAVERLRPDVVQIETTEMAQYLPAAAGHVRALDLQDIASRWFQRVVDQHRGKGRALLRLELAKARRYDRRHARLADVVFVSSDVERAFLRDLAGVDAIEISNGVDTASFAPMPEIAEEPDRIAFVGPMSYVANLEGMRWFAREVFGRVRRAVPAAGVDLIGAPAENEGWPEGFSARGRVDDVRPWLARATVSIVPVLFGSGTRYKILEALSMGRAVVSTTVGAEGLGLRDREHLVIADDPDAFADAIVELMSSPGLRSALAEAGREHVLARYDWGPLVSRMEEAWSAAVERRASTSHE